jgi:hypothetical protein
MVSRDLDLPHKDLRRAGQLPEYDSYYNRAAKLSIVCLN